MQQNKQAAPCLHSKKMCHEKIYNKAPNWYRGNFTSNRNDYLLFNETFTGDSV